mgnify:CR=1 FL=1
MSFIETSFVIASRSPKELAEFYAKVHKNEICKGISSFHYVVPLSNGLKIHIYNSSNVSDQFNKRRSACLCFQKRTSSDPISLVKQWSMDIEKIGGNILEDPRQEDFGAEAWISDPEGNDFLIFVPNPN